MSKRRHRKRARREEHAKPSGRRVALLVASVVLAAMTLAAGQDFRTLNGRWLRPDGGYILEIWDVDAGGKMDAVYLNPRPIHVARAEVTRDGSTLKVFVELRAPGYPGSTYTLTYDPKRDQFEGAYFQAALKQSFDVVFIRMK